MVKETKAAKEDVPEDSMYEVEEILGDFFEDGIHWFYVHWKGWTIAPEESESYVPLENMNCPVILNAYLDKKELQAKEEEQKAKGTEASQPSTSGIRKPPATSSRQKEQPAVSKRKLRTSFSRHSLEKDAKRSKRRSCRPSSDSDEDYQVKKPTAKKQNARRSNRGRAAAQATSTISRSTSRRLTGRSSAVDSNPASAEAEIQKEDIEPPAAAPAEPPAAALAEPPAVTPLQAPTAAPFPPPETAPVQPSSSAPSSSAPAAPTVEENNPFDTASVRKRNALKKKFMDMVQEKEEARRAQAAPASLPLPPMEADPNIQGSRDPSLEAVEPPPMPEDPAQLDLHSWEADDIYADINDDDLVSVEYLQKSSTHPNRLVIAEAVPSQVPRQNVGEDSDDDLITAEEVQNSNNATHLKRLVETTAAVVEDSDNDDDLITAEDLPNQKESRPYGFEKGLTPLRIVFLCHEPGVTEEEVPTSPKAFGAVQYVGSDEIEFLPMPVIRARVPWLFSMYIARINAAEQEQGMDVARPSELMGVICENLDEDN